MKETDRLKRQLDRFENMLEEMGRLLVSLNGEVKVPGEAPQVSGTGTQPPFVSDPKTESEIDRYIRDWRERTFNEHG